MTPLLDILAEWWLILLPVVYAAAEVTGILSAWHAALRVRTSQAAVAWAAGLIALPLVAVPLYWIFGRNRFGGYRNAIQQVGKQHKASVEAVRRELQTEPNARCCGSYGTVGLLADVLDTPLSLGNQFQLLVDGEQFFAALLEQIASAEKYVYAQFYILRDDPIGNKFADALCKRAQAGVQVRLLYDEVGCLRLSRAYLRRLRDAGVEVLSFNTRQGWANRFQFNFRNHRKILVIDGQRAITGGFNVGEEYLGRLRWASDWRDTAVRVDGPAARKLQAVFASDYYWAIRRDLPEANWNTAVGENMPPSRNGDTPLGAAAICATGPADQRALATMMYATAAGAAQRRLWISSPYLVPDDTCITTLAMARARGVDVRLLVPAIPDKWIVFLAGYYYERVFEANGIRVYRYDKGFLHQKCVLVDDDLALIGSTNLDNRSLHLNFELMLAAGERQLVDEVAKMLEHDFTLAECTSKREGRLLPWYIRVGTVIARLFSPVL